MATSLASLSVIIGANLQPLERDLRRARTITSQNVKAMQSMSVNAFVPSGGIKNQWATAMGGPMYRSMPSAVGFNTRAYQQAMNNAMWARQFQPSASQQWMEATGGKPYVAPIPKPPKPPKPPRKSGGGRGFGMGGFGMLGGVGGMMHAMGLTTVAAGFGAAVREGEKFNQAMQKSTAIMGEMSEGLRSKLAKAAVDASRTVTASATEVANSLFFMASAGLNAQQAMGALVPVTQFAQAGNMNLATAAELATQTTAAFGLKSKDAATYIENLTKVTDVLAYTNIHCQATVEQLARSMANKGAARARLLGKSVEETASILAVYADQGKQAEEAGTYLDMMWRELSQKAAIYGASYRKNGIEVFDELTGEMRHTADIIKDIENALRGKGLEERIKIMNELHVPQRALVAILPLLGKSAELMERYNGTVAEAGGSSKKLSDVMRTKLQSSWADLSASVTEFAAIMVNSAYPAIENTFGIISELVGLTGDVVTFWQEMSDGATDAATALGLFDKSSKNGANGKSNNLFGTVIGTVIDPLNTITTIKQIRAMLEMVKASNELRSRDDELKLRGQYSQLSGLFGSLQSAKDMKDWETVKRIMEQIIALLQEMQKLTSQEGIAALLDGMANVPDEIRSRYPKPAPPLDDQEDLKDAMKRDYTDADLQKLKEKIRNELQMAEDKYDHLKEMVDELIKLGPENGGIFALEGQEFLRQAYDQLFPTDVSDADKFYEDILEQLFLVEQGWDDAKKAAYEYLKLDGATDAVAEKIEKAVRRQEAITDAGGFRELLKTDKDRDLEDLARIKELGTQGLLTPEEVDALAQQFVEKWSDGMEALRPMSTGFTGMAEYARELQNALLGNDKEKLDKDRNKTLIDIKKAAEDTTKAVKDAAKQPARMGA